jgi:phage terminase large subunit-like protein
MVRDRLSLTQRADLVMNWHRRWRPIAIGYERYGMMADIEHIRDRQETENYRFPIIELGGQMPKEDRIRRLIPWFEQGRIYLPHALHKRNYEGVEHNLVEAFRNEEYLAFPVSSHDDMLDALARLFDEDMPASFPAPMLDDQDDEPDARGRSAMTGY